MIQQISVKYKGRSYVYNTCMLVLQNKLQTGTYALHMVTEHTITNNISAMVMVIRMYNKYLIASIWFGQLKIGIPVRENKC